MTLSELVPLAFTVGQIDDILFDVGTPSEDDDVSFEIKDKTKFNILLLFDKNKSRIGGISSSPNGLV